MPWSLVLILATAQWRQVPLQVAASEPTGAASVTADLSECARATRVRLWWTGTDSRPPQLVTKAGSSMRVNTGHPATDFQVSLGLVADQAVAPCRWTFSALPPGPYVVGLEGPQGSGGSQAFEIAAGRTVDVAIPPPTVTVSGRVRFKADPSRWQVSTCSSGDRRAATASRRSALRPRMPTGDIRSSSIGPESSVTELHAWTVPDCAPRR